MSLDTFLNTLSRELFGISRTDAHERNICVRCKKHPPENMSPIDQKEYEQSGLCPHCWEMVISGD